MATEGPPQGPASPSGSASSFIPNSDLLASAFAQMPQAPPFFANPFMASSAPFPNGTTPAATGPNANVAFPQSADAAEFRANPFAAGGYFLSPGQYQEMMQQYMMSWMTAAAQQNKMPDSQTPTMPFPFAPPPFFGASPPPVEKKAPDSNAPPALPQASVSLTGSPSSGIRSSIQSSSTACSSPSLFTSSKPSSCSPDTHDEDVEVAEADVAGEEEQEPQPSVEDAFKGISLKEEMSSAEEESAKEGAPESEATPSTSAEAEAGVEPKEPSPEAASAPSTSSSASDCRTSVLIKKQMSEMDKEISRRTQNKHIKQIDESELEQLLNSSKNVYATTTEPCFDQAALNYTPEAATSTAPQKPSLNQLQASFAPPTPTTPTSFAPFAAAPPAPFFAPQAVGGASTVGFAPQAPQASPAASFYPMPAQAQPQAGQPAITAEMAAALLQQLQQNPTLLQSASRLLQQQAPTPAEGSEATAKAVADMLAMLPTMSMAASSPSSTATASPSSAPLEGLPGALPPPPRNAQLNPKSGPWPEENGWVEAEVSGHDKENAAQEPVWVMRDSYLKRLQRDEERLAAAENPPQEEDDASTSSPETAL
uniref:Myb-like domain-containing protein n=1 Tax=Steinernema glaseri TaxID=37863 RepID=A0A1I7Z0B9_9BILA